MAAGSGGEEENEAKQRIEEHKATYKDMFTRLRGLKAEIEQIQVCPHGKPVDSEERCIHCDQIVFLQRSADIVNEAGSQVDCLLDFLVQNLCSRGAKSVRVSQLR